MSIEVNWDSLTSGPNGEALAERIRIFIHDKFQSVPLPRFIKSVTVHGFDFGRVPPDLVLKDITDPLPDFYDEDEGDTDDDDGGGSDTDEEEHVTTTTRRRQQQQQHPEVFRQDISNHDHHHHHEMAPPYLGTSTPGILGGPGLNYFHGHLGTTGTNTPLAAVAGAHHWMGTTGTMMPSSFPDEYSRHRRNPSQESMLSVDNTPGPLPQHSLRPPLLRENSSVSTLAPTSGNTSPLPPPRDAAATFESAITEEEEDDDERGGRVPKDGGRRDRKRREPRVDDFQSVFRIRYSGDVRLNLTAEILLDYPMPSFVGIPLKLNITGLSFDGVGVLAKIRKRLHFCFLSPEDAVAAVAPDDDEEEGRQEGQQKDAQKQKQHKGRFGGLLQEIKVESEIGEREGGKQSLKNVGKVERFVLEQVRRIFEEEFVYPSFWTFLV